jgi:hypothetical protein
MSGNDVTDADDIHSSGTIGGNSLSGNISYKLTAMYIQIARPDYHRWIQDDGIQASIDAF